MSYAAEEAGAVMACNAIVKHGATAAALHLAVGGRAPHAAGDRSAEDPASSARLGGLMA